VFDDCISDVGPPPPTGQVDSSELRIHLSLYPNPRLVQSNDGTEELPRSNRFIEFTLDVAPEEAVAMEDVIRNLSLLLLQVKQSDGKAYAAPILLAVDKTKE